MGSDISKTDLSHIKIFANKVIKLAKYRIDLYQYLCSRMEDCAPNMTALLGEQVGARLIAKAGSLIKLAKYPASTVQILGAEKALFRALKSKGKCNTPKYGLIYNSSFITKATKKDKGRVSRYLANKTSMAVRLDCFLDKPTNAYGITFKKQVEDRLNFFKSGKIPDTNESVMHKITQQLKDDEEELNKNNNNKQQSSVVGKKRKAVEVDDDNNNNVENDSTTLPPNKKLKVDKENENQQDKKDKKKKKDKKNKKQQETEV